MHFKFLVDITLKYLYCIDMYVTEKYLKMEVKELNEKLHSLANDLGGDIRYLHQELVQLQERIELLQQEISNDKNI